MDIANQMLLNLAIALIPLAAFILRDKRNKK